jgi:hypothetical protein
VSRNLHVFFFGLVLHKGADYKSKDTAILVNAKGHTAKLWKAKNVGVELKKGDVLSVRGATPGPANTSSVFQSLVPNQRDDSLTASDLTDDVKMKKEKVKVAAYFVYPLNDSTQTAGTLEAVMKYGCEAEHYPYNIPNQTKRTGCVAKLTMFTVKVPDGDVIVENEDGDEILSTESSCLLFLNSDDPDKERELARQLTSHLDKREAERVFAAAERVREEKLALLTSGICKLDEGDGHALEYGKLFKDPTDMTTVRQIKSECKAPVDTPADICGWVTAYIEELEQGGGHTALHAECGNNQWP